MSFRLKDIASIIEDFAPLHYQESYDNSGLLVGEPDMLVTGAIITLDVTEEVVDEAIAEGLNLIIAHHPLIFKGVKRLTGRSAVERCVMKALRNGIAIYAAHTNLDSVRGGVSNSMCKKLGLQQCRILSPLQGLLLKLTVFVPHAYADVIRTACFSAGAGHIGNYDLCSFNLNGEGSFRGNDLSKPFVGEVSELHVEPEQRIEMIVQRSAIGKVVSALLDVHPYEEPAYDIYPLENSLPIAGLGMWGVLPQPVLTDTFLQQVKLAFNASMVRYTKPIGKTVSSVAVCGGSGISLLNNALSVKADAFITADIKYHDFFEVDGRIQLIDVGHYESEQFAVDILHEVLSEKIPTFAARITKHSSNPINYM